MAEASYPEDLLYHAEHDWARIEGEEATFGITWYAQDQLGEVVFFDPPEVGTHRDQGRALRRGRVGQGRLRRLRAALRRDRRGQRGPGRQARERSTTTPTATAGWCSIKLSDPSEADALMDQPAYTPEPDVSRYTSVTDADRAAMLEAIGVASVDDLFADIPENAAPRARARPPGRAGRAGGLRPPARAGGPQRLGRRRDQLRRRGHVRPLRAGAGGLDRAALGVPHPLHALPARDLAGRAAGDVRVPDRDLRAHRPAGLQRVSVYEGPSAVGAGRLRWPDARTSARSSWPRAACTRTRWRRCGRLSHGYGTEVVEVPLRDGATDPDALAAAVDDDTGAVFLQQPNFLGAIEDLDALAAPRQGHRRAARRRRRPDHAGPAQAAGRARRRPRRGGGAAAGQPPGLRRPVLRILRRQRGATAAHARAASRARPPTSTAGAGSCSPCRRASSTSGARRRPRTSAPRRRSTRCAGWSTWPGWGGAGWSSWPSCWCSARRMRARTLVALDGVALLHEQPVVREFALRLDAPAERVRERCFEHGIDPGLPLGGRRPARRHHRAALAGGHRPAGRGARRGRAGGARDEPLSTTACTPTRDRGLPPHRPARPRGPDRAAARPRHDDLRALGRGPPRVRAARARRARAAPRRAHPRAPAPQRAARAARGLRAGDRAPLHRACRRGTSTSTRASTRSARAR